ncbi:MAG: hypothetical protein OIF32_00910 [Campylobacterales bacterium]|nr:hypothetical protein [Campylobacterales bacterium]
MTFSQVMERQQKLLAVQTVLFSFLMSLVVIVSAVTYSNTTLYDKEKEAKKPKNLRDNKTFERMYQRPQ